MLADWIQDGSVVGLVATSALYLSRGLVRSLRGRGSGLGNCCSHGCQAHVPPAGEVTPLAVHYIPSDDLARRAKAARVGKPAR